MRGFVANTDFDWYQFLRARPELREVNFWRPSQSRFGALESGELFFFKLKAPHNAIGGFGLFTQAAVLPIWEAWDVFGLANGVADCDSLLVRLERLSHGAAAWPSPSQSSSLQTAGCRFPPIGAGRSFPEKAMT
jgi:hypothetical protein